MTFYEGEPLSAYECYMTTQRVLSDAELLRDGARIMPPGVLLLSDVQLELAQRTLDPLYVPLRSFEPRISEEEEARERWLQTEVFTLMKASGDIGLVQKARSFRRENMPTVRDLLVVGKEIASGVCNVGDKTIAALEAVLNTNDFGITWKSRPTMSDIHALCTEVSQVNAQVLSIEIGGTYYPRSFKGSTSVDDVLKVGPEPPEGQELIPVNSYNPRGSLELYHAAKLFEVRFQGTRPSAAFIEGEE